MKQTVYFINREIQLSLIWVKPNDSIGSFYSYTNETFTFWASYFSLTCKTWPINFSAGYSESLVNLFWNAFYFIVFSQCLCVQCFLSTSYVLCLMFYVYVPATLLKRDSNTVVFLWNLEHLFWSTVSITFTQFKNNQTAVVSLSKLLLCFT